MSNPTTPGGSSDYMREAAVQDALLDERLIRIRVQADLGIITIREAADQRVAALEHHIEAVKALRQEHFGNGR